jgi:hypothetical protein
VEQSHGHWLSVLLMLLLFFMRKATLGIISGLKIVSTTINRCAVRFVSQLCSLNKYRTCFFVHVACATETSHLAALFVLMYFFLFVENDGNK